MNGRQYAEIHAALMLAMEKLPTVEERDQAARALGQLDRAWAQEQSRTEWIRGWEHKGG